MLDNHINIHKKTLNGNNVLLGVYSDFVKEDSFYIIKFNDEKVRLTVEKASMDYRGKACKGTRDGNATKFSYPLALPLGRFDLCEEESSEDILVYYLD